MSKLDTARSLLNKAGREDTPIEEARASALTAARLIYKHKFVIEESLNDEDESVNEVRFPDDEYEYDINNFEEVEPFKVEMSKHVMTCVSCNKEIRKGIPYARGIQSRNNAAHYECRRYFTGGK